MLGIGSQLERKFELEALGSNLIGRNYTCREYNEHRPVARRRFKAYLLSRPEPFVLLIFSFRSEIAKLIESGNVCFRGIFLSRRRGDKYSLFTDIQAKGRK
jgi:hypothetical protein